MAEPVLGVSEDDFEDYSSAERRGEEIAPEAAPKPIQPHGVAPVFGVSEDDFEAYSSAERRGTTYAKEFVKSVAEGAKNLPASALKGWGGYAPTFAEGQAQAYERQSAPLPSPDASPEERAAARVRRGVVHRSPEETEKLVADARARAAIPVKEQPLYKAGQAIEDFGKETLGPAPGWERSWTRDIGSGFGSMAAGIAFSMVPGVGPAGASTMFLGAGMGEAVDNAIKHGATEAQVRKAAEMGVIAGATDMVDMLIPALGGTGKALGFIKKVGTRAIWAAMTEGGQEGLQQLIQNMIAKGIYKPDQDIWEDVPRSAAVGMITGGVSAPIMGAIEDRFERRAEKKKEPGVGVGADDSGQMLTGGAEGEQPASTLDRRVGFLAEEARSYGDSPDPENSDLLWSLEVASGVNGLTADSALPAAQWAMANGREDIAQALVDRAYRDAIAPVQIPLDPSDPNYAEAQAQAQATRQDRAALAIDLVRQTKLSPEGFTPPPAPEPAPAGTLAVPPSADNESILPPDEPQKIDLSPGVKAYGQDRADELKRTWASQSPIRTIDDLFAGAQENQDALGSLGEEISDELGEGVNFINPGVKGRKRTQEKIDGGKAPGRINDVVRAGFEVARPGQAEEAIARIAERYPIVDEGWAVTFAGYFDRKVLVRFPNGQVGEIQFWHPDIAKAKSRDGHKLYVAARELKDGDPRKAELIRKSQEIYRAALESVDPEWKAVVGKSGIAGNLASKASLESGRPSIPISAEFPGRHSPSEKTQASSGDQTQGSPSTVPNLNFSEIIKRSIGTGGHLGKAVPTIPPHRVTAAGGASVEVAPVVVEADDVIASSDPGYDAGLQPRQRDRAAAEAQVRHIATNLDPVRLGYSAEADRGAPIVGPDGMVESGNGRVLALRRAYSGMPAQSIAYRDWLAKQGVDVAKFRNPILVRVRTSALSPDDRRAFTVGANKPATLAMSAPERALADARVITPSMMSLLQNPDDLGAAANRPFIRAFVAEMPVEERGVMAGSTGALSAEGLIRVRNALLAKAYGDVSLLNRIAEAIDDDVRSISNALIAAAPAWAALKTEISDGRVRADMDVTADLMESVRRTADIRAAGVKLEDHLAQIDAFDRNPVVEDFMRMFYHPSARRALGTKRIVDGLRFFAQESGKVTTEAGLDLGLVPVDVRDVITGARERAWKDVEFESVSNRSGPGDGGGATPAGGQIRRPRAGPAGEGAPAGSPFGDAEAAARAQRPGRAGRQAVEAQRTVDGRPAWTDVQAAGNAVEAGFIRPSPRRTGFCYRHAGRWVTENGGAYVLAVINTRGAMPIYHALAEHTDENGQRWYLDATLDREAFFSPDVADSVFNGLIPVHMMNGEEVAVHGVKNGVWPDPGNLGLPTALEVVHPAEFSSLREAIGPFTGEVKAQRPENRSRLWEERIARDNAAMEAFRDGFKDEFERSGGFVLEKGDNRVLASRNIDPSRTAPYRMTVIDEHGPVGHIEFSSLDDLVDELARRWKSGWRSPRAYPFDDYVMAQRKADPGFFDDIALAGGVTGKQGVLPGAERITTAEQAQRRANAPLRPRRPQAALDFGLFGDNGLQNPLPLEGAQDVRGPEGVRGPAPQVPGGEQARRPRRTQAVRRPVEAPLFDWGGSGGNVGQPDVTAPPQPGGEGPPAPGEGGGVTKPPSRGGRGGSSRPRLPAPIRAGLKEAEEAIAERSRSNYRITPEDRIGQGTAKEKVRANIDAIRLLKQIEDEGRPATPEEKSVLVRYSGWGAFAQDMFDRYGPYRERWKGERDALRTLLTEEEYEAARASTLNAHFTSPEVISGMWGALDWLGFKGGAAIEPAAGVGHFIGLIPDSIAPKTAWTAVELDTISGRLTKALYGGADVNVMGFEKLKRPSNYFDLAVSNVPFGDYNISEKPYGAFPIHDFFFVKSLDKVRPGGVVAFITSRYTMDKVDGGTRRLLAKSADLVGAIRLPGGDKGAFSANAGTQVTTDILFLRKKIPGEPAFPGASWIETKEIQTPEGPVSINEYFADNPSMMLGEMRLLGSMYRANEPVLIGDPSDLENQIRRAAAQMPQNALTPRGTQATTPPLSSDDVADVKDGAFFVRDGALYRRVAGQGVAQDDLSAQDRERVTQLIGMRDVYNRLIDAQLGRSDEDRDALRADLRAAYDRFVEQFGPINKEDRTVTSRLNKEGEPVVITRTPNLRNFRVDPDAWKVASIEDYNSETGKAKRADFQVKDVIGQKPEPDIRGAADALAASLSEKGSVDLDHIGQLIGATSHDEVIAALGDQVYQNPNGRQWETADAYLSGNVVKKLEEARAIAESEPAFARNVAALEKVQPTPLTGVDITAQLGAAWIPPSVYKAFFEEIGGINVKLARIPLTGDWKVSMDGASRDADAKYGNHYFDFSDVVSAAMNGRTLTARSKDSEGSDVVNAEQTEDIRVKIANLKEAFAGDPERGVDAWAFADPDRAMRLAGIYNRVYNNLVARKYDGSHLTLPGINPDFATRKHRKDAVWRIIQAGNTLLAHCVGSGKSATMMAAGMEQKRLGLINKPAYVVPNHMLEQFAREFIQTYPNANILVASKEETSKDNRKSFLAKAASNNWDGIIITHDAFGRIGMSDEHRVRFIRDQLDEMERVISAESSKDRKSPTVKELEKKKKRLVQKLKDLMNEERKDDGTTFEESGIDFLFYDEAHLAKNLAFVTRMTRVKGFSTSDSQRAEDLFLKIRYLEQNRPGRSAVFATGTPVSNTMAELWTMQRYLQFDKLKERGLDLFDDWANTFGRTATNSELSADGRTFKDVTSFSRFVNIPELIALYSEVADTQTAEMLNLPRPGVVTLSGEKGIEIVTANPSDEEEEFIQHLVKLAESLKGQRPEKGKPNMLSVVTMGRKVATDGRMIGEDFKFNRHGKIALAVENIHRLWKDAKEPGMAQGVFLDLGVPTSKRATPATVEGEDGDPAENETFRIDLYSDIKQRLVEKGVPPEEIAFVHSASDDIKKARLFQAVRDGRVRIILGSTAKMGVGTNMQKRLIALHHLDAPWRPADVEQRDGRIVRQGNLNPNVHIFRYVTARSFDAFMWQTLDRKAKFIGQVLSGARGSRTAEDIDNPLPEAAQMKAAASGDVRVLEHAELDREVRALTAQRRSFEASRQTSVSSIAAAKARIAYLEKTLPKLEDDAAQVVDISGDKFVVEVGGVQMTNRTVAGKTIIERLLSLSPRELSSDRDYVAGTLSGFDMVVNATDRWAGDGREVFARLKLVRDGSEYASSPFVLNAQSDPVGMMARYGNILAAIRRRPVEVEAELKKERDSVSRLEKSAVATWPHEALYRDKLAALKALTAALQAPTHPDVVSAEQAENPNPFDEEVKAQVGGRDREINDADLDRILGDDAPTFRERLREIRKNDDMALGIAGEAKALAATLGRLVADLEKTKDRIEEYHSAAEERFDEGEARKYDARPSYQMRDYKRDAQSEALDEVIEDIAIQAAASDISDIVAAANSIKTKNYRGHDEVLSDEYGRAKAILGQIVEVANALTKLSDGARKVEYASEKGFESLDDILLDHDIVETLIEKSDLHSAIADLAYEIESGYYDRIAEAAQQVHDAHAKAYARGAPDPIISTIDISDDPMSARDAPVGWVKDRGINLGPGPGEGVLPISGNTVAHVPFEKSAAYTAKEREIAAAVHAISERMAPQATVRAVRGLRVSGRKVWGIFANSEAFPQFIAWSLEQDNRRGFGRTLRHEILHHLKNAGLITDPEWAALVKAAEGGNWIKLHNIDRRYSDASREVQIEEAIAEHFGKWRVDRSIEKPGLVRDAFHRLDLFFRRVAAAVRKALGMGATASDIFTRIETGEVGRRFSRKIADQKAWLAERGKKSFVDDVRSARPGLPPSSNVPAEVIGDILDARNWTKLASLSRSVGVGDANTTAVRVALQDKFIRWKNLQDRIEQRTGARLPDSMNVYQTESLYYGRTGERLERLEKRFIDPIIAEIESRGLTLEDVDKFLMARHAPERNAEVSKINPGLPNPSGMSDAEARDIINDFTLAGKRADLDAVERLIRRLITETQNTLLAGGLISRETLNNWRAAYQHYVPLRGFADFVDPDDGTHTGQGFDIRRGPEDQRALGRSSLSDSPLAYVFLGAQQAIVRSEKNRVGQAALEFVTNNPDPSLWQVNKGDPKRVIDKATGVVKWVSDPTYVNRDNVFSVKVDGKPVYINFKGEFGESLARALKNLGTAQANGILRMVAKYTHFMARLATSWNPDFMIPNFVRDAGEAFINLHAEDQREFVKRFAKHLVPAIGGSFQALTDRTGGRYAAAFREFDKEGGRIRFFGLENPEDIKRSVAAKMRRLDGGVINSMKDAGKAALDAIEIANGSIENATRLAAFMAGIDVGLTPAKAASIARELTVNFNRKGEYGSAISSLYMFANASIQGQARMLRAMTDKRVRRFAYGLAAAGAALAVYNLGAGGDDDDGVPYYLKLSPWLRDSNLILMFPKGMGMDGKYASIPLPYGYAFFNVIGSRLASMVYGGEKPKKALSAILKSTLDAFDPLGRDENMIAQFLPTAAKPFVHLYTNENWTGKPINPTASPFDRGKADSERYFRSASPGSVKTARWLNQITGGDPRNPGLIDVSPGSIDYVIGTLTGGLGRFLNNSISTAWGLADGTDWKVNKTPVVHRFFGEKDERGDKALFYEERDAARAVAERLKGYQKDKNVLAAQKLRSEHKAELRAYSFLEQKSVKNQFADIRKKIDEIRLSDRPRAEKERLLKEQEDRELKLMGQFRARLRKAKEEEAKGRASGGRVRKPTVAEHWEMRDAAKQALAVSDAVPRREPEPTPSSRTAEREYTRAGALPATIPEYSRMRQGDMTVDYPEPPAPTIEQLLPRDWPTTAPYPGSARGMRVAQRAAGGRVDRAAINHAPTEAQKSEGNYAKDHVRVHGLDITIENAKGAQRSGVGKDGKPWRVKMPAAYGYIRRTEGADGDHVDVYLGPHIKSPKVFVVDQHDAETGRFDEHKVLLGMATRAQAERTYCAGFSDGKGRARLRHIREMTVPEFKAWLASGDTTEAIAKHPIKRADGGRSGYGDMLADARDALRSPEPIDDLVVEPSSSLSDRLGRTWPARAAKSAFRAVTLPGDVYAGKVAPGSDEAIGRAADLGGMLATGAPLSGVAPRISRRVVGSAGKPRGPGPSDAD